MVVTCMSFGYKYGIPPETDLLFDVRCLPNPFYVPELKHKTGLDQEVVDYVVDNDMFAIVNMHGDGYYTVDHSWLLCAEDDDKQT